MLPATAERVSGTSRRAMLLDLACLAGIPGVHVQAVGAAVELRRSLAADLDIARNTIAEAYAELVAEGWLIAERLRHPGPGSFPI